MKHILQVLAVVLILSATAYAAYDFQDVINQHVDMSDDAALTFPDGDYSVGGWVYWDNENGNQFTYIYSWGAHGGANSSRFIIGEVSSGTPKQVWFDAFDAEGDRANTGGGGTDMEENAWHHWLVVRSGEDTTMYYDGVADSNANDQGSPVGTCNAAGVMFFGESDDTNAVNRFEGRLAYWAKWDRALTQDEITALAGGCAPTSYPTELKWYLPMEDFGDEQIGGITITDWGASALIAWDGTAITSCGGDGVPLPAIISIEKSGGKSNYKNGGKQ